MTLSCKICGVSDKRTLLHLINHPTPPNFIGFICNFPKSKRHLTYSKLTKLLKIKKKKSKYVAVLVNPRKHILEKIKKLPFDYYQIYDSISAEVNYIKKQYKKKIIVAITVNNKNDVLKYAEYKNIANVFLFDSKGYEKSLSFNHKLIKDIKINKRIMLAGNIKYDENLDKYSKITDIIDISGSLESSGKKDISKIDLFLKNINKIRK
tara:strand:+ start:878 stop:1501 length:624 start_codon:yes stop_codon:yes gene_type:complete